MPGRRADAKFCSSDCRYQANRDRLNVARRAASASDPDRREKRAARNKAWALANAERVADYHRQRYLANRTAILSQQREYREANKDARREKDRAYYYANRSKWQAGWRNITEDERSRRNEQHRERWARKRADGTLQRSRWKEDNPEQAKLAARIYQSRRRAWKRATTSALITRADLEALVRRHQGLCAYCEDAPATDIDHVVPLSRGGRHAIGNLLPACGRCNRSKGAKTLMEWRLHPSCSYKAA